MRFVGPWDCAAEVNTCPRILNCEGNHFQYVHEDLSVEKFKVYSFFSTLESVVVGKC